MAIETTQRVRGLYGKVTLGTAATGTQTDAGGEVRNWELSLEHEAEDARGLADYFEILMTTGGGGSFSCEKMIVTDSILTVLLTDNPVLYVALYQGRSQTVTTGTGTMVLQGMVVITSYRRTNQRGPVLVNVTGRFTGVPAAT